MYRIFEKSILFETGESCLTNDYLGIYPMEAREGVGCDIRVSLVQTTDVTVKSSLRLLDTAAVTECRPPRVAIGGSDAQ